MSPRSVRLGSAGKTFSFTGWKVGWATGPPNLLAPMIKAHQFLTFTVPPALQHGVAHGLERERSFYLGLGKELAAQRRAFAPRLAALGFGVLPAQATYFLVADARAFASPEEDDAAFCVRLAAEGGVALIPVSAFYLPVEGGGGSGGAGAGARARPPPPRTLCRFAFCKGQGALDAAVERLEAYLGRPGRPGPGARGDVAFAAEAAAMADEL
jgi:N-succinyldiaminopimelate aminotransferase